MTRFLVTLDASDEEYRDGKKRHVLSLTRTYDAGAVYTQRLILLEEELNQLKRVIAEYGV